MQCSYKYSLSHTAGGCAHPELKKLVTCRHDEAHTTITNAINKGHGSIFFVVAELSRSGLMHGLKVHHKCMPKWVLHQHIFQLDVMTKLLLRKS